VCWDGRESHRVVAIRNCGCDFGIIHTHLQKYYRTGCLVQSKSDQIEQEFPWQTFPHFYCPCQWGLAATSQFLTVTWLRGLISHKNTFLLCFCLMLVLEFEPLALTVSITQLKLGDSGPALTARSNQSRAFLILRYAQIQPSNGINHEWVSLTFPERAHFVLAAPTY
jgi:hypothetical protein